MATTSVTRSAAGGPGLPFFAPPVMLAGRFGGHGPTDAVGPMPPQRATGGALEGQVSLGFRPAGQLGRGAEALLLGELEVLVCDPGGVLADEVFCEFPVPGSHGRDDVLVLFSRALDTLFGPVRELGAEPQGASERFGGGDHVDQAGVAGGPGDQLVEFVSLLGPGLPGAGRCRSA